MTSNNAPDLASVLRTLSTLSGQPGPHSHDYRPGDGHINNNGDNKLNNDAYEPPDAQPLPSTTRPHHKPSYSVQPSQGAPGPTKIASNKPSSNEASSITTWPAALKHVMRTVGQSEDIQQRIRFLIQRQHEHERQWWQGREALVKKQKARAEKKKELDQVLRSVGAPIDSKEISTAEEDQAEVENYDSKVYRASKQMASAMGTELRTLGIPFFCLKSDFILDSTSKPKETEARVPNSGSREPDKQQPISRTELSALQHRVLDLLQDLCKD